MVRYEKRLFSGELAMQRFALVVELGNSEDVDIYERIREWVEPPRMRLWRG